MMIAIEAWNKSATASGNTAALLDGKWQISEELTEYQNFC